MTGHTLPIGRRRLVWWSIVVVITALSLGAFASESQTWFGSLPATFSKFDLIDIWSAPVSCALGAWLSGQALHHGFLQWQHASARTLREQWWAMARYLASAVATAHIVVFDGLLAASLLAGAEVRTGAWMMSGSLLVTIASSLVWVCVGLVLGRWLPVLVALLVSLTLPYGLMVAVIWFFPGTWLDTLSVYGGRMYIDAMPDISTLLIRVVFWLGLATWCAGWLAGRKRVRAGGRIALWVVIPVALFTGGPSDHLLPHAHEAICAGTSPVVCVDRAHRTVLGEYSREAAAVTAGLPAPLRPDLVRPADLKVAALGKTMEVGPVNGKWSTALRIQHTAFVAAVGNEAFLTECRREASATSGLSTPPDMLNIWWRLHHGVRIDTAAFQGDDGYVLGSGSAEVIKRAQELERMTPSQREAWFAANLDDALACKWPA